jgi:carboxylesterase type B
VKDKTLPTDLKERLSSGRFLKVPVLTGNNANEGDLFAIAQAANGTLDPVTFPAFSDAFTKVSNLFS